MKQTLIYSLKVWLTTVVVAPLVTYVFICFALLVLWNNDTGLIFGPSPISPAGVIANSLHVTPIVLIILVIFYLGRKTPLDIKLLKLIITAFIIVAAIELSVSRSIKGQSGTLNPFVLIFDSTVTAYSLMLTCSIWFYKLVTGKN